MTTSWRDRVQAVDVDADWLLWWVRSWRITRQQLAEKCCVTRMTTHRWLTGEYPIPDHVVAWAKDNLPNDPALPYPGMPDVEFEPATEVELREFSELEMAYWSSPRKRKAS